MFHSESTIDLFEKDHNNVCDKPDDLSDQHASKNQNYKTSPPKIKELQSSLTSLK